LNILICVKAISGKAGSVICYNLSATTLKFITLFALGLTRSDLI